MKDAPIPPEDTHTMAEVRFGVDAVDAALVELLATRFGYMRAAARIKPSRDAVRDEARKAEVIAQVRAKAVELDIPVKLVTELWEQLVEASISYELQHWDQRSV